MEASNFQLVCCVVITLLVIFVQTGSTTDISMRSEILNSTIQHILGSNDKLSEIGSYGDKIYFRQLDSDDCAFQFAKDVCINASLEFAWLNTQEELTYLGSILGSDMHWVDGRGNNEFYWTPTGEDVNYSVEEYIEQCVAIHNGKLKGIPCLAGLLGCPIEHFYTLCQLTVTEVYETV